MKNIRDLDAGRIIRYGRDDNGNYRPLVVEIGGKEKTVHAGGYGRYYIWHNRTAYQVK